MEYGRYCMRGHEWVDCTCYVPDNEYDDDGEPVVEYEPLTHNYKFTEVVHYSSCSCVGVYCEDTGETIRVQCAMCREGAYVTHMIGGYLNSIGQAETVEDKVRQLGSLFRYIYTVEDFLVQHLSFTYSLYEKCQELEDNPKCEPILKDIRAVKRLIERL